MLKERRARQPSHAAVLFFLCAPLLLPAIRNSHLYYRFSHLGARSREIRRAGNPDITKDCPFLARTCFYARVVDPTRLKSATEMATLCSLAAPPLYAASLSFLSNLKRGPDGKCARRELMFRPQKREKRIGWVGGRKGPQGV